MLETIPKSCFKLPCKRKDLQLLGTLNGGQSFRWRITDANNTKDHQQQWLGVFAKCVWILQQHDDHISYQVHSNPDDVQPEQYYDRLLTDYFRLDLDLERHYAQWSDIDPYFRMAASQFYGIRILKQDLVENIFSFICSSNNNIARITSMVEKLASFYGEKICDLNGQTHYTFPTVETLAQAGVEAHLKQAGFGYRAKYISKTAQYIVEQGNDRWLDDLRELSYESAKIKLMSLTGVGPKVADCICLMSLGHLQTIPIDTHVYQIARNFYMPKLPKQKTVTPKLYKEIGEHFRKLYGPLAGWAHTVLFCADLKKFQNVEGKR